MTKNIENNLFNDGKRENKIEIAERMLDDGISIEKMMSLTDLPREEVQRIFNEKNRNRSW